MPEDQGVHVEEAGNPIPLVINEDERPGIAPLVHRAWPVIRTRRVSSVTLNIGPGLPFARREELFHAAQWLLRRILKIPQPAAKAIVLPKPPSTEWIADYMRGIDNIFGRTGTR